MKVLDALKISTLAGLLLVIFSLPTLTATQLVGVLGTRSQQTTLTFTPISDDNTFTTLSGDNFNVSFQNPRIHEFATVTNPGSTNKSFTLQILTPKKVPLKTVFTFSGKPLSKLDFSQYNNSVDLVVGPHQSVPLAIDTTKSDPDHGTVILSVSEN